jgi:hypothetical protein
VAALKENLKSLKVGDPFDLNTFQGPQVESHFSIIFDNPQIIIEKLRVTTDCCCKFLKILRSLNFNLIESWLTSNQVKTKGQPVCSAVSDMVKRVTSSNPRQFARLMSV